MADNVYLLETRLSPAQQAALVAIRAVAKEQGLTVFLVGGAVRDLISGSPVRDLDVAIQGNALGLRKQLEAARATFSGQSNPLQSLYVRFPSGVRVEVGSTLSATWPKPGKPVYQATTILEDLRRRDFTANAMALSLNDGSYGLLMDPLNGVADIENRELRLVSNYGFIEDPARLIRAARFMARLGWQMDERTRARYETAKEENYIAALQPADRGYEVEELFHEEEPLRVMRRLEEEGWLKHLSPVLSVAKVNAPELARLRDTQMQLETRGIRTDASAANFPLLTTKIPASDIETLKKSFPRTAFVAEINALEAAAKELGGQLVSKAMSLPSEAYKLIQRADPVTVLWTVHTSKSAAVQARFKSFMTEWPQAQTKIPVLLMAEMRITPELPGYAELQETLFYALMDGRLTTPEEMKAFLEPYSPPAPPPPVSLRRPRAPRKEAKAAKSRKKVTPDAETEETALPATSATAPPEEVRPAAPQAVQAPSAREIKAPKPAVPVATSPAPKPVPAKAAVAAKAEPVKKVAAVSAPAKKPAAKAPAKKSGKPAPAVSPAKQAAKPVKATAPSAARKGQQAVPTSKTSKAPVKLVAAKKSASSGSAKKAVPAKKLPVPAKKQVVKKVFPAKAAPKKSPAKKVVPAKKAAAKKTTAKRR